MFCFLEKNHFCWLYTLFLISIRFLSNLLKENLSIFHLKNVTGNCHFTHCRPFLSRHQHASKSSERGHIISGVIWPLKSGHEWKLSNQKPCSGHVNQVVNKNLVFLPRWPDLGQKWVRLAQNGTNPLLFQIRFRADMPQFGVKPDIPDLT